MNRRSVCACMCVCAHACVHVHVCAYCVYSKNTAQACYYEMRLTKGRKYLSYSLLVKCLSGMNEALSSISVWHGAKKKKRRKNYTKKRGTSDHDVKGITSMKI